MGHLLEVNVALCLLPCSRTSAFTLLLGVPFERAIRYHRWVGRAAALWTLAHMIFWWGAWQFKSPDYTLWGQITSSDWNDPGDFTRITGHLAFLVIFIFGIFTFECTRRGNFELFYYTHHLAFVYMVFSILHSYSITSNRGNLMAYCLMSTVAYTIDRLLRIYRGRYLKYDVIAWETLVGECVKVELTRKHAKNSLLEDSEALGYYPGQYCFLCVHKPL